MTPTPMDWLVGTPRLVTAGAPHNPIITFASIGGFTVTSHAVSRGRLAPLVGKRFVAGGLRVYFAWIHASFAFILLTHKKIMILFCVGVGYLSHCVDGSF